MKLAILWAVTLVVFVAVNFLLVKLVPGVMDYQDFSAVQYAGLLVFEVALFVGAFYSGKWAARRFG